MKTLSKPNSGRKRGQKTVYWEGNRALIFYLYEKIEKLEQEVEELKSKNK